MGRCIPTCIVAVVLLAVVSSVAAVRKKRTHEKVYDIKLLVTRHGLSCTNMVQTWIGNLDAGRRNIHDPLLTGAGVAGAQENAKLVDDWLSSHNLKIDAVLSSVLARAMETAFVMYPSAAPLHVVPFVREYSAGLSNAPIENRPEQIAHLNSTLKRSFQLDYQGIDQYGIEEGTWDQFTDFLEQSFLPELVLKLGKPSGSTIVLPVVTHSKFMRDSTVGEMCGSAWTSKGNSKPLNSQVVQMSYSFEIGDTTGSQNPSASAFTLTGSGTEGVDGLWKQSGVHNGRPEYEQIENDQMKIQWNERSKAWHLSTSALFGFSRSILYQSLVDSDTLPSDAWERVSGKEPAPQIRLRDGKYKLKVSDLPCEDVASGQSYKDSAGKLIEPICLKDVGDACIDPIKQHSWSPGSLWSKTYEGIIEARKAQVIKSQQKITDMEKQYDESARKLVGISDDSKRLDALDQLRSLVESLKRERAAVVQLQTEIPQLANADCWSGGHPDPEKGNVGR